ncbi:MAG: S9 family peptidase [Proteobacteria bacterium]|nr:S9 family peptidase [Pseudomonadota bacterium]
MIVGLAVTASHAALAAEPAAAPPAAAAPAAPAAPAWPPSVADFAQIDFVEDASISPNGRYLAGIFGFAGRQVIGIVPIIGAEEKPIFQGIPDKLTTDGVMWVNDNEIIVPVTAQEEIDAGENWYISRAISLNRTTGKVQRLLWNLKGQHAGQVLWLPHDGSSEVLMEGQDSIYEGEDFWPAVYRVNVSTAGYQKVVAGRVDVRGWQADATGTVRMAYQHNDEKRISRLLYRGEGGGLFRTIDRADTGKSESVINTVMFMPGSDHALTIHDDDKGLSQIYETDLATRTDIKAFYTAPAGKEVGSARIARDGSALLGVRLAGVHGKTVWLDPAFAALQDQFDKAVGDRRATIISYSADRTKLLVIVDRENSPGALYYYDTQIGTMQRIAFINKALGTRPLAPVKMVSYQARDGLAIEAVLTVPRDREAKNLPIIMLPHGGPWAADGPNYDYWAQFLASRGYVVMQPNFRGSTGYGSEFETKGEGQMGLAMQDDITDGLAWAVKQGLADPRRACIVGGSYGGYAAMWGLAKDPDLYRCAISIAGVSNVRRDVNDFNDIDATSGKDAWKRMSADFAAISPINAVDRIKAPLLLIHGKKDGRVDFHQSTAMESRMRAAGKKVELLLLPEADHHFGRQADREALLGAIETFLRQHNPAN